MSYTYISTEKPVITQFYTGLLEHPSKKYFIIGVRDPTDDQGTGWKYNGVSHKVTIKSYYLNGKKVVVLYASNNLK